jgi:hypothetical protein
MNLIHRIDCLGWFFVGLKKWNRIIDVYDLLLKFMGTFGLDGT